MRTASAAAQTPVDYSELHQQPIDAVLRPTFVYKLCYKLPSVVPFTFLQTFDWNLSSLLSGVKVSAFAWYSVKIRAIFGVRFERQKVDKREPTWKLNHANSIVETFEYFCQIASKSIVTISSYTVSKLGRFFWDTVYVWFVCVLYVPSVLWYCWLGLLNCKTVSHITYTVLEGTWNTAQSNPATC